MDKRETIRESIISKRLETPQQQVIESEMNHRRTIAKELGRIIPDNIPDFIGNFNSNGDSSGIFEMYIEEKKDNGEFNGLIEDCYGTANFKGRISNDRIVFHKKYITEKSSVNAAKGGLIYEGEYDFLSNSYIGNFTFNDYPRVKHHFELTKDLSLLFS